MASEILGCVQQIGNVIFQHVKDRVDYLVHYKRYVNNFTAAVETLGIIRNDVQVLVEAARQRSERIYEDVEAWLTSVEQVEADARKLENELGSAGWFSGQILNCCLLYNLGKEAKQKINNVEELVSRGRNYRTVSHDPPPPSIDSMFASEDYVDFKSREAVVKKIMKSLEDEAIGTIGVYGMGGVGKTTLMFHVGKLVKNKGLYDHVVFVEVTPNPDVTMIQGEIAGQLDLELNENELKRKGQLFERLQRGKTLVILDNVWKELKLNEIGIPCGDKRKGCKIMLTTRNADVCHMHGSQEVIQVGVLTDLESWKIFTKAIGDVIDSSILDDYGKHIVKECGCVPLLIAAVGKALRHQGEMRWADASTRLRNRTLIKTDHREVFSCLEMSYDYLESEEIKSCFLFCCLFPEDFDIEIEMLMRYGFGEALFDDVETIKEARVRVHSVIDKLKARCLLSDGDVQGLVKMHDAVRDVARSIASNVGNVFLVKAGSHTRDWQTKEKLNECKRVSLNENKISMLSEEPDCPNLLTLLLQDNHLLQKIPDRFFQGMKSLVVLDLSYTRISSLPRVTTLRALFLVGCMYLSDVSLLGEMNKLEILDLSGTDIHELPEQAGRLSNLKLLDLSDTEFLKRVPPNVISKLQCLEELYMGNSFSAWEVEGIRDGTNASIAEVTFLNRLTTLYICVKNVKSFLLYCLLRRVKLERLEIEGCREKGEIVPDEDGDPAYAVNAELPPAFENLQFLTVWGCNGLKNLLSWKLALALKQLKELSVEDCDEMEVIIANEGAIDSTSVLPRLRCIYLSNMPNLKSFSEGEALRNLPSLLEIHVDNCSSLKRLPFGKNSTPPLLNSGDRQRRAEMLSEEREKRGRIKYTLRRQLKQHILSPFPQQGFHSFARQEVCSFPQQGSPLPQQGVSSVPQQGSPLPQQGVSSFPQLGSPFPQRGSRLLPRRGQRKLRIFSSLWG